MNARTPTPVPRDIRFANCRLARAGIDAMTLAELRTRATAGRWFSVPERSHMVSLTLFTRGQGLHTIDFEPRPVQRGSFVFGRPGQVQQWHMTDALHGLLVLIEPGVMQPGRGGLGQRQRELLGLEDWPGEGRLEPAAFAAVLAPAQELRLESARPEPSALDIALVRELLACLLMKMRRALEASGLIADASDSGAAVHRLLLRELERQLGTRPGVRSLAARLGYSASTLNRACRAATGRSAKETIDHRIVLEARRLLVHSDASAAGIARNLGFSEPTNFLKFFRRLTGETPEAFRRFHSAGRLAP